MAIKKALLSVGGTVAILGLASGPAMAGSPAYCGVTGCDPAPHTQPPVQHQTNCGSAGCDTGVAYMPSPQGYSGPTTVENRTPYDFLDSVHFQRSPHVSITRVHGLAPTVGLGDAPIGFTQGCHPQSTAYCRTGHQGSATASASATVSTTSVATPTYTSAPVTSAHASAAATTAPQSYTPHVYTPRPHVPDRVVAIGGGFDPSKFMPRIYGDPYTITPGIAYLPTSVVDRNPYRAQAVLDAGPGGVTPALSGMPIGPLPTPRPYMMNTQMSGSHMARSHMTMMPPRPPMMVGPMMQPRIMQAPMVQAPMAQAPMVRPPMMQPQMMRAPMMPQPMMRGPMVQRPMVQPSIPTGHPGAAGAPVLMQNGRYGSRVGADGTYWERVSGPTQIGNMAATQVICKRRMPHPAPMPHPTPYPMPHPMPPTTCNGHGGQPSRY